MLKRTGVVLGTLLLVLLLHHASAGQTVQTTTAQMPTRFEVYFEQGIGDEATKTVKQGNFDAYDSEKKTRVFDAVGGQITYQAELTDDERKTIFESIVQNNLLAVKDDFTNVYSTCGCKIDPLVLGRLRLDIDGRIKEIRFVESYGSIDDKDGEWPRLRNVLKVIDAILRTKDAKQNMPQHKAEPEVRMQWAPVNAKIADYGAAVVEHDPGIMAASFQE